MTVIYIGLFVVAFWAVARLGLAVARLYLRFYEERRAAADEFYETAGKIIDSDHVAAGDLDIIENMNSLINEPLAPMALFAILRKNKKMSRSDDPPPPTREIHSEIVTLLVVAYDKWFTATTGQSPYFGSLSRILRAQREMQTVVRGTAVGVHRRSAGRVAHAT